MIDYRCKISSDVHCLAHAAPDNSGAQTRLRAPVCLLKTCSPVEAAVRLHHRLVFIHPFANANGRHARIMADTLLIRVYPSDAIDWTAGFNFQKMSERRRAYIAALKAADNHDLAPLLAFAGLLPKDKGA